MKTYQIYLGYGKNIESVDEFFYIGRDEAENEQQAVLNVYNNIEPFVEENAIFKATEEDKEEYSYYILNKNNIEKVEKDTKRKLKKMITREEYIILIL